ncbi:MAG: sigma-70 family RNA polymerase sigma factor [Flavobacteriales bacterium]|nr:sigma-70 family RNA polymerase sigma factor [Flavobacteriales bacterium]
MRLSEFSEKELVQAYLKGNELALEQLITRFKSQVYTYIICKVKHEALAEDIFQDTFIKVINTIKKGKYNDEGKFLPWVMRIAHNLIIDHYRKNKRMPFVTGNDEFDIFDVIKTPEKSVQEHLEINQDHHNVKKLIKNLPADQKEVLMMRLYYDMSFKEISETTNVSINTALGRMRYALINLRKMAEEKNMNFSFR